MAGPIQPMSGDVARQAQTIPEFPVPLPEDFINKFPELKNWESKNREQWKEVLRAMGLKIGSKF